MLRAGLVLPSPPRTLRLGVVRVEASPRFRFERCSALGANLFMAWTMVW
jgi:hypothetical protein